jgi:hypothetical protein
VVAEGAAAAVLAAGVSGADAGVGSAVVVVVGVGSAVVVVADMVGWSVCGCVVVGGSKGDASRVMRSVLSAMPPTEAAATVEQSTTFPMAVDTKVVTVRRFDGRSDELFNGNVFWLSRAAAIIVPVIDGSRPGVAAVAWRQGRVALV